MGTILKNKKGQFIPITGMVLFTMVVFLVAVVNIYHVARAKLQVQNLADAAALNLASQQAQIFNLMADKNEWLNHMMEGAPIPTRGRGQPPDCSAFTAANKTLIPGVSCVENNYGNVTKEGRKYQKEKDPANARHIFWSRDGAIEYALVIRTVNIAQKLFLAAYNSFIGAPSVVPGAQGSNASPRNFSALLKRDIPALSDPDIRLVAWNDASKEKKMSTSVEEWESASGGQALKADMVPLNFEIDHDLSTRYFVGEDSDKYIAGNKLGELLFGCVPEGQVKGRKDIKYGKCGPNYGQPFEAVGWMRPVSPPKVSVPGASSRIGVGVIVQKKITLPVLGSKVVAATSKAYLMQAGDDFHPTYWVKLGK